MRSPHAVAIQQLFEDQVRRNPEATAILFRDEKLSYRELNERSNQLAHLLRNMGVARNDTVAIMIERSFEMIIGIFAILKAGAAYLPINPAYPQERTMHILQDSQTKILLTYNHVLYSSDCVVLPLDKLDTDAYSSDNPALINEATDLVYVIYTSGSTGKPKGVMIEHQALINRINWMQKAYPLNKDDTILLKTNFTFDVSVWELIWWSIVGAKVCILEPRLERFPQAISQAVQLHSVTVIHFVPSMLNAFLNYFQEVPCNYDFSTLRFVFSSGEELLQKHVQNFNNLFNSCSSTTLVNLYGPTEATIDVTYYNCPIEDVPAFIPIGKAIDNTELYVIKHGKECLIGEIGELHIGGICLARGYVNNPRLTAEKFISHPYKPSERVYKTGDLVCWLPDGNMEYHGRIDHQVKIRGLRIELGEVESVITTSSMISECTVMPQVISESITRLIAFVKPEEHYSEVQLIEYIKRYLPEYMLPYRFIIINSFPLTDNGKLDRGQLMKIIEPFHLTHT
ncbi:non-ribosomal peptide synthetase [Paenibacillus silvae]|uniref:non-ribosomal peptide synthetase n=1 Tax=Paenibacillus silvae TaxID=1325358 RepID=UPI0020067271|nr:amino acid adenylation domain-containing protein [Paenibacillus silvae]MCK6076575.1 amino acid adenylation domain-containing protein [Paenibacillus silvae]MCK6151002.1 amino acid adenylation domain-containing protein [Paenibacillus silvae]MCK6269262.1 amino acid adenylation domain-containing protein [Paenibacillus silvae]